MEQQIITLDIEKATELVEEKKFGELRTMLMDAEAADIALLYDEFPEETYPVIFRLLPKELAAEVFVELDPDKQEVLISSFNDKELKLILDELYLDDTVDIIEEMPANVVTRLLANCTKEDRATINKLLEYPDDSAGSVMTTEYVSLRPTMTVSEAFDHIRQVGIDSETVYSCYVTENRKLVGTVSVLTLLLSDKEKKIADVMTTNVVSVGTLTDEQEVAELIQKYDYLAMPVVDKEDRLVGIVTVDDAIDVIQAEGEEDISVMAAITPDDTPYLKTSPVKVWLNRIPWLIILMVASTFTGIIISSFEDALSTMVVLTAFIPLIMGTGGNAGSQASVAVIRAISMGEVKFSDTLAVLWRDFLVSILCGVSLGAATFVKTLLIDGMLMSNSDVTVMVAFTVGATIAATVFCAKMIGSFLPILADKIGLDPAVMASPFITTIVDALSLIIYFVLATSLLHL